MPTAIMSRCQQPMCLNAALFEAIVPRGEGQPPANLGPLCGPCGQAARRKHADVGLTLRLLEPAAAPTPQKRPTYGPLARCQSAACSQLATKVSTTPPRWRYCERHAAEARALNRGLVLADFAPQPVEQRQARERIPDLATMKAMAASRAHAANPLAVCGRWPCARPAVAVYASTLDGQRERRCARHAGEFEKMLDGAERARFRKLDLAGERIAWLDD